jgi:hypothetical protein
VAAAPGHKAIVVIAVEGDQAPERVRMRRIPNVKQDTLSDFVLAHLEHTNNKRRVSQANPSTGDLNRTRAKQPLLKPRRRLLFGRGLRDRT